MTMPRCLLTLALFALGAAAQAADLAGVNLGTHLSGPKVAAGDLAGKVVIFEYWGVNCPPCVANIPHVSELAAVASPEVLAVIANHCQGPGKTMDVWKSKGGTDKVTVIEGGELPGSNVSSIPRIFVFDHTGKQVFDGSPSQVTAEMITSLVQAAPGPMVSGGPYTACAKEAAALRSTGPSIAPVLKSLRSKAAGTQEKAKAEATEILASVTTYLDKTMQRIEKDRETDPVGSMVLLNRMVGVTKGDELGKPFQDLFTRLKADKAFQAEVTAAQALAQIKDGIAKIDDRMAPPAQRQAKQQAAAALSGLIKKYPATKAAGEAEKVARSLN